MTANIVDSSGWLEYLADTERAALFAPAIEEPEKPIVPAISIYEVFKKILRERGEEVASRVASMMQAGQVIALDATLALEAAKLALPLADSIIYATAQRFSAQLWTQDEHFKDLPAVRYFPRYPAE